MEQYIDREGLRKVFELIAATYVTKEEGKVLSSEDYTLAEKRKLASIEPSAQANVIEKIMVNGEVVEPIGKTVSIVIPETEGTKVMDSAINGNIIVGGEEVEVYALPTATAEVKGGVTVGGGISLLNGEISVTKTNIIEALDMTPVSEAEVRTMIQDLSRLSYQVVDELPEAEEAEANIIYMVKRTGSAGNNYIEYMLVDGDWEVIGSTTVDLSNYVKKDDYVALTDEEITEIFKA